LEAYGRPGGNNIVNFFIYKFLSLLSTLKLDGAGQGMSVILSKGKISKVSVAWSDLRESAKETVMSSNWAE